MPNYPYYYQPYQPYQPPMADQLMQLRQNQYMPMQNMQQVPQQSQQTQSSMIWVPSEQDAINYIVAPNTAVAIWNSNLPVVYLKQADASGKPSMITYDLVERTQRPVQPSQTQHVEYATKEELKALAARLDALAVKEVPTRVTTKKTVKEDAE